MPGMRCMLEIGGSTLITQIPDASTLPPPAPPEPCDPFIPLPFLPNLAQQPGSRHGAFHEASLSPKQSVCFACCPRLAPCQPLVAQKALVFLGIPARHGLAGSIRGACTGKAIAKVQLICLARPLTQCTSMVLLHSPYICNLMNTHTSGQAGCKIKRIVNTLWWACLLAVQVSFSSACLLCR